jgi:hypothetical protein
LARQRIDRIEALIHRDVGRGANALFAASRGGLFGAAAALTAGQPRRVGILTGFFVPSADPPAAETDGPAGAALLALALSRVGIECRLLTDTVCRLACKAALAGAGVASVAVDAVGRNESLQICIDIWRVWNPNWMIAIERCGLSADGIPRNMRGEDVGAHTAKLDHVFIAGPWRTIAIGDGGNEVGMVALPAGLIARDIPSGGTIACVTPAEHLITAGVSHWGAYALIAALALMRQECRAALRDCLDPEVDARILRALVEDGPAVDGVTLRHDLTIDGLDLAAHRTMLESVRVAAGLA